VKSRDKWHFNKNYERNDFLPSFRRLYEFDELWSPDGNTSAREFLEILDQDQEFFQERLEYL